MENDLVTSGDPAGLQSGRLVVRTSSGTEIVFIVSPLSPSLQLFLCKTYFTELISNEKC